MVLIKKGTLAAALVAATLSFGHAAYAQDTPSNQTEAQQTTQKFSEEELEKFVEANTKVTEIQKEGREGIVAAIEEQKLTVDRFNELAKAHRAQKLEEVAENPEEISAFSNAAQNVVKLQPETRDKIQQAIVDSGLTKEKYDTIMQAYESDPEVQVQIRRIVHAE
ncbi:uncharacterized protein DUF4168 [Pontibacter ummariensis]|uniref:DUF4168 domain-containing protein n=1 Tax=Pontibacter ummariensis TaxID=1610492 RepID=A0A239J2Q8_9BACT|nr:DUF4168 domain-containing protein [Pontibacter ummariensis]PRY08838.1 uncharacterized protein DUF4168 [Pontibacter ummariensis]SNS99758.1 protein of unknown function [Pontibacter ummariensis]